MTGLEIEKTEGEGTPILFIHGWMGSKESWRSVRKELDLKNPLIFYDQRCHGDSSCSEFSMEDLADDLAQVTEGLKEPILVGHSMGGMTALTYTLNHDNYSGLLLLGTCASTPKPRYKSPSFFLDKLGSIARETWADLIADNYAEDGDSVLRDESFKELVNADKEPLIYGLKSMINFDIRDQLDEEKAVVVAGKDDGAIQPDQSRELAEILNCEFKLIDSSHLILQEKPKKVAEIIEDFVKSQ